MHGECIKDSTLASLTDKHGPRNSESSSLLCAAITFEGHSDLILYFSWVIRGQALPV